MNFNQWASAAKIDDVSRASFEAVWNGMVRGCTPDEASFLLTDLVESLPETPEDEEGWFD